MDNPCQTACHGRYPGAMHRLRLATAACCLLASSNALAEPTWRGDFEGGDLGQWSYLLNEEGLSVVTDPVLAGSNAGQVQIGPDNLWSNGLNRVEFQRTPSSALTAEGSEVYFGWSIYLPQPLTSDDHQLGYWETDVTYRQVMSLHAEGQDLSFNTNSPAKVHWRGSGRLTAQEWHRIVYHVLWNGDSSAGKVSLWFDGEKVVDSVSASTYLDNPAFIQLGILRDTISQVETLIVDEALEGATFEDVAMLDRFPLMESTAPPEPTATQTAPAITPATPAPSAAPAQVASAESSESDSGCSVARRRLGASWWVVIAVGLAVSLRRRLKSRKDRLW